MTVTVIICAYTLERWDALKNAVGSCLAQTRRPDQVVVVVDHNDELLERATAELEGVVVLANASAKGLSGARNTGVEASSGDVIAFLDDDAFADPDWLAALCIPFEDDAVAGVGGWIVPEWQGHVADWFPETYYWILGCSYQGLPPSGATLRNPIGANMAIRRRVFAAVGGFTSGIGRIGKVPLGCEETELCIRYTARAPDERFVLARDAVVHHLVPRSRLSWHYFRSRCWAEGLSKAAVSSLVGSKHGLASERAHLARSLPRELGRCVAQLPRHPRTAATKGSLILVGASVAAAGLVRGTTALRREPIKPGGDELKLTTSSGGDTDGTLPFGARRAG
jgi:glycosyltransferase involved in cell wall biosynthesis